MQTACKGGVPTKCSRPGAPAATRVRSQRPSSHTRPALPEASLAFALAFLPWNGCSQGGTYDTGVTNQPVRPCQQIYQPAAAAEAKFKEARRQEAAKAVQPAPPPQASPPEASPPTQQPTSASSVRGGTAPSGKEDLLTGTLTPISTANYSVGTLGAPSSRELQQPPVFMRMNSMLTQPQMHSRTSVGAEVTLVRRGACAEVEPCAPSPQSSQGGSDAQPPMSSNTVGQQQAQGPTAQDRPVDALSSEAKTFLRDDLNAQRQQRGKELAEAAWQTLE